MQYGKYNFQSASVLFLMHSGRDASSVVGYGNGIVFVYSYVYIVAESCKSLVYGIVNNLINKMMKSSLSNISDIH